MQLLDFISDWKYGVYGVYNKNADKITFASD